MDKKIKNLGNIEGKILLFGGVYSNLQALEKIKQISETLNIAPENCICTGDIIGYCAQPEESLQLFKLWGAQSIVGNVEIQLRDNENDCGCDFREGSRCDGFSQLWYPYAQSKLTKNSLEFIATLPDHITFNFCGNATTIVHGSYTNVSEFIFKSTPWEIKQKSFLETQSSVIIAGHCGLPFKDELNNKKWINPGVIGMPANDGEPHVWYAIMEEKNGKMIVTHYTMKYNHQLTSQLMKNGLLPEEYARTIITGIWDNTEILPAVESGMQGFGIRI